MVVEEEKGKVHFGTLYHFFLIIPHMAKASHDSQYKNIKRFTRGNNCNGYTI